MTAFQIGPLCDLSSTVRTICSTGCVAFKMRHLLILSGAILQAHIKAQYTNLSPKGGYGICLHGHKTCSHCKMWPKVIQKSWSSFAAEHRNSSIFIHKVISYNLTELGQNLRSISLLCVKTYLILKQQLHFCQSSNHAIKWPKQRAEELKLKWLFKYLTFLLSGHLEWLLSWCCCAK